jgi:hypothetical protein
MIMIAMGLLHNILKDQKGEPERGEWMGADKNSTQEFSLWTQDHSKTSMHFSCQIHVVTKVLLDLGNGLHQTTMQKTRSGKQLKHNY